jgi:hypothetical protein
MIWGNMFVKKLPVFFLTIADKRVDMERLLAVVACHENGFEIGAGLADVEFPAQIVPVKIN